MRRIKSRTAGLIIVEVILLLWFIAYIASHNFAAAVWVFLNMLLVAGMYFMDYMSQKLIESSRAVRSQCDELRNRNDVQSIIIKNLMTENAELRKKLSRKRPKPQTEEKSDE